MSMCGSAEITWAADSYSILIPVTYSDTGEPVDLTGASVEAAADRRGTTVAASASITDAPAGVLRVAVDRGKMAVGAWRLQARVTLSGEVQTVYDGMVTVYPSVIPD